MRPQVLVVEDADEIALLETRILEREGYDVARVASGAEALEHVRTHVPDVILSDIMMPEIDGYRLLELLRADPRLTAVPVIFVSALGDAPSLDRGRRLGVDQYLVKPFTAEQLRSTVSGTLRRYRQLAQAKMIASAGAADAVPAPHDFERIGIAPVDQRTGGFARGRCYLVIGAVGGGPGIFGVQFLHGALERGEGALLVTTERLDSVLYAGTSVGLALEPHVRSGRLVVAGLVDRFEYMLETRDDIGALAAEIAEQARACGATRIALSSILTVLCSAPRLVLSAPLVAHFVSSLEGLGATTVLSSDIPVTPHEELAEAYLRRTTFGTVVLSKDDGTRGTGTMRFERFQGLSTEPAEVTFAVAYGAGLVTVDPNASPHVYDELDGLRSRIQLEVAKAGQGDSAFVALGRGAYRLRDPFVLYLRDCVSTALRATQECAIVACRFDLGTADGAPAGAAVHVRDLTGILAGQEILCWAQPHELVVLALGADADHAERLRDRLARWLGSFANDHALEVRELITLACAYPSAASTVDGLLELVDRALARADGSGAVHAVA